MHAAKGGALGHGPSHSTTISWNHGQIFTRSPEIDGGIVISQNTFRMHIASDDGIVRHLPQADYLSVIAEIHIKIAVLPRFEEISIPTRAELTILLICKYTV